MTDVTEATCCSSTPSSRTSYSSLIYKHFINVGQALREVIRLPHPNSLHDSPRPRHRDQNRLQACSFDSNRNVKKSDFFALKVGDDRRFEYRRTGWTEDKDNKVKSVKNVTNVRRSTKSAAATAEWPLTCNVIQDRFYTL